MLLTIPTTVSEKRRRATEVHGLPDKLPLSGTASTDGRPEEGEQPPPKRANLGRHTTQTPYLSSGYSTRQVSLVTLMLLKGSPTWATWACRNGSTLGVVCAYDAHPACSR